jgi:hypothetical protein
VMMELHVRLMMFSMINANASVRKKIQNKVVVSANVK